MKKVAIVLLPSAIREVKTKLHQNIIFGRPFEIVIYPTLKG